MKISQLLKENGANINAYARFEKGEEGLEKEKKIFAEEVMKQIK